jgi:hypothetical protein
MDVVIAVIDRIRRLQVTTFTIDADNITAFATPDLAAATVAAGAQIFTSQQELAELAAAWPADRLVAVWNTMPGEAPVKKFKSPDTAISRIWARVQRLAEPEKPKAQRKATVGAHGAKGVLAKVQANKKDKPARKANKPPRRAAAQRSEGPREGSKTAQVVAMLERKGGVTLKEIIAKMGWQQHTVRGFMAGTMKKAGYAVESFKPEGGERTYRIAK